MTTESRNPIEVFFSYSHKDERFKDELVNHLSILKRQGVISDWHDRKITAGSEWAGEIDTHLNSAHIILLLISSDFLASNYCYDVELKRAIERHEAGEARVIPVILRPVDWRGALFGELHALPKDAKPVTSWRSRDEAFADVVKGIRAAAEVARVTPMVGMPNNHLSRLPTPITTFIGRVKEVAAVGNLIQKENVRLTTLTGPGGTGKTRLALQVAANLRGTLPDGVWFIDLAAISDSALVGPTIATTLGVTEAAGQPLVERLKVYLSTKQLLLLLDNFEQVLAAAALVDDLLHAAPYVKILVTSRALLNVYGERNFPVQPLALPTPEDCSSLERLTQCEAIQLFVERAQAAMPDFALTDTNATDIVEICNRLDGLPLAIELAAARIRLLPPKALLRLLSDRFKLLIGGSHIVSPRHQTLRATIAWSYDLLDASEQDLFERLAVFVGGWTIETATAVSSARDCLMLDVLDGIQALLDKSLVRLIDGADGEPRYSMLETIREYALERLVISGKEATIRQNHVDYFLSLALTAKRQLWGPEKKMWLRRLESEHDNLRAAIQWTLERGSVDVSLDLISSLTTFWWNKGYLSQGRKWAEAALQLGSDKKPHLRAKVLSGMGLLARDQGDTAQAELYLENSLPYFRKCHDKRGEATALRRLGTVYQTEGKLTKAIALYEEALAIYRKLGNGIGIAAVLYNLGWTSMQGGDFVRAKPFFEESLALSQNREDSQGGSGALVGLGWVALELGDFGQAQSAFEESVIQLHQLGIRRFLANSFCGLAALAEVRNQNERAAILWGIAEALAEASDANFSPIGSPRYKNLPSILCSKMGDEAYRAALHNGREMPLEQIIDYALTGHGTDI